MKLLFLLVFSIFLNFFGCQTDGAQANSATPISKNDSKEKNMTSNDGKSGDIEYAYKFEVGANSIKINYRLKNTGKTDYLIFNRGAGSSSLAYRKGLVYAEAKDAKTIEISQKMFEEPQNSGCPDRLVPIRAGASKLKAGESVEETVEISKPLKVITPFDDCTRIPQLSGQETVFRFCLGVAPADAKTEIDEEARIKNWETVGKQQLLCSEEMKLN